MKQREKWSKGKDPKKEGGEKDVMSSRMFIRRMKKDVWRQNKIKIKGEVWGQKENRKRKK